MSERDPLADRFAAFRDAAIVRTTPPGVEAVRRTVGRRDAVRTMAVGAVAAILAIAFVFIGATGGQPQPIVPTPTAPPSSPSPSPSPSTVDTPPGAGPTSGSGPTNQNAYSCSYGKNGGPLILGGDSLNVSPSDYWNRCPNARVRIYTVVYEWDVSQQRYTPAHLGYIYLTSANRTAPVPSADLDPIASVCGYAFLVVGNDTDPPAVLAVEAADNNDFRYWYEHGLGSPTIQEWRTSPDRHQLQICQPPASVTP